MMKRLALAVLAAFVVTGSVHAATWYDRVAFYSSTGGNGAITPGSAFDPTHRDLSAVPSGSFSYVIHDGSQWETDCDAYWNATSQTLSRNFQASSTGSLLNLDGLEYVELTPVSCDWNAFGSAAAHDASDFATQTGTNTPGDLACTTATGVQDCGIAPVTLPLPAPQIMQRVCQSWAASNSHTGDTAETTLGTCSLPANLLGLNGCLYIRSAWSSPNNNADTKTVRIRFSGASGTIFMSGTIGSSVLSAGDIRSICNRDATNVQVGGFSSSLGASAGTSGGALVTASVDTTAATSLVFTVQLGTSTDTLTLEGYTVWFVPG